MSDNSDVIAIVMMKMTLMITVTTVETLMRWSSLLLISSDINNYLDTGLMQHASQ